LLCYNYNETDDDINITNQIAVNLKNLPDGSLSIEKYLLDAEHNNTYRTWQRIGSPEFLKDTNIDRLWNTARLSKSEEKQGQIQNGKFQLRMDLPRHSMQLLICNIK